MRKYNFEYNVSAKLEERQLLKEAQQVSPKVVETAIIEACDFLSNTYSIVNKYRDDHLFCNLHYDYDNRRFYATPKIIDPIDALILFKQPILCPDSNPYTYGSGWMRELIILGFEPVYQVSDLIKWFGLTRIFWLSLILGIYDEKPESKDNAVFNAKAYKMGIKLRRIYIDPQIDIINDGEQQ